MTAVASLGMGPVPYGSAPSLLVNSAGHKELWEVQSCPGGHDKL